MFLKQNRFMISQKDFEARDRAGNGLLYVAVSNSNLEVAKLFMQMGADVNQKNQFENTCLHKAMQIKDYRMFRFLSQMQADQNAINSCGLTPIQYQDSEGGVLIFLILHR